jgi:hypothetical protein
MRPRLAAAASMAVAALLVACSGGAGDSDTGAESTASTAKPAETRECVAPTFQVEYPAGWSVNAADEAAECRWFHPHPFELPEATDAIALAVHLRYEPGRIDALAEAPNGEVIDRAEHTVNGRRAVRIHARASAAGLLPAGTQTLRWYLDTGPRTLVAATSSAAAAPFEQTVEMLDRLVRSIRVTVESACSSVGLHVGSGDSGDLPGSVVEARNAISRAALACDYEALAQLASGGNQSFSFSFGGGDRPEAFWRDAERSGEEPLRRLVLLLQLAPAVRPVEGGRQFIWPAAYAYERWDDVPESDRAKLQRLYSHEVIDSFDRAGAYLGHRVGIDDAGEWLFFVAGD